MQVFRRRIEASLVGTPGELPELVLSYEKRQKTRARHALSKGSIQGENEIGLDLTRGTVLRSGDVLEGDVGEKVLIRAAIEQLLEVRAADTLALTRIAYHLGNRHVAVAVLPDCLRIELDHVLENMVIGLGGKTSVVNASFDPENGAYSGHSHAGLSNEKAYADTDDNLERFKSHMHAPQIHDFLVNPLGDKVGSANQQKPQ